MWIRTETLYTSKRGNAQSEYEDAFFPRSAARERTRFRCAVADGASESAFAGLWAKLLVTSFGRRRLNIDHLRQVWQRAVGGSKGDAKALPWYLQKKVGTGAHAAFLGLSVYEGGDEPTAARDKRHSWLDTGRSATAPAAKGANGANGTGGRWRALAVGDSCLFQVRESQLIAVGPIQKSDQFDNSPCLVGSRTTTALRRSDENVTVLGGRWQSGDVFYLATDAMSKWLLAQVEAGKPRWALLRAIGRETFVPLVTRLRAAGELHNDDTTLMRVEVA